MKFIQKGRKPAGLAKFERDNAKTPQNLTYDGLTAAAKSAMVKQMLEEQGGLCGYTMRRIDRSDSHIEHIRSRKHHPELQIEYANLILCAPGGDCDWGARCKDEANVDERNFVSPLRKDCETRFLYRLDGSVRAADKTDAGANSTLSLLNLNHRDLIAQRLQALRVLGLAGDSARPLSARMAKRLSERICEPNADGSLVPFCIALRQAADRFARKTHDRSVRIRDCR